MKRINVLFVMAWLCLVFNTLKAQEFPSTYFADELHFAVNPDHVWFAQRTAIMSNNIVLVAPEYEQIIDGKTHYLNVQFDGANFRLNPGEEISFFKPNGRYTLRMEMMEQQTEEDEMITENEIQFQVKEQSYIAPDEVWEIGLADTEYTPPFDNLYTSPHLMHYNTGAFRQARAMVKLGEGNTKLTRPIIFVDGVDFSHDVVLERGSNRVIRYGDTGWENVIQGVESNYVDPGESELFRSYPTLLKQLSEDQDENGAANYDIILVEFQDGADYIDRCALLLRRVIERVNAEKECGYENVIVGLSMGGQVSRIALTQMERDGIDHDCSEYISFDSPHQYANIPLGIQAMVYAAGFIGENENIRRRFEELNRPAALQMLRFNLYTEMAEGNVTMKNEKMWFTFGGIEEETEIISMQNPIQAWLLRDQYVSLQEELGYPMYCKNVAVGMGSNQGTPLHNSDCLLDGHLLYEENDWWDVLLQGIPDLINAIKSKYDDDIFGIKLNSIGADNANILEFKFLNGEKKEFNHITLSRNVTYPNVDVAPGCSRNDILFLKDELDGEINGMSIFFYIISFSLPSSWSSVWYCDLPSTTFMPSASVIGVETDDLTMNIEDALQSQTITSPFDEIFLTEDNLQHVEIYGANENNLLGNDVGAFLVERAETNVIDIPELTILPSTWHGSKYNYGLFKRKISSFIVNNGGILSVNHTGATHFVDINPEEASNKALFISRLSASTCLGPTEIVVNSGGLFQLGDPNNFEKSGEVRMFSGSSIQVNKEGTLALENSSGLIAEQGSSITIEEGTLALENSSRLIAEQGSSITIEEGTLHMNNQSELSIRAGASATFSNTTIVMDGNDTKLSLAGNIVFDGDVTIHCNGEIDLLSTANITINGRLTIIGDDMDENLLHLREKINLTVNGDFSIHNGTIAFYKDNKIEVKNGEQTTFQNIIMKRKGDFSPEVHIQQVQNVSFSNVQAANFKSFTIEGKGKEYVQIENTFLKNCGKTLLLNNLYSVQILNSEFIASHYYDHPTEGKIRPYNGVDAKMIQNLNVENTTFDGFIYDPSGLKPDNPRYYALNLLDANTAIIKSSRFINSNVGINVLEEGSANDDLVNETNVYLYDVIVENNRVGIDMSGARAKSPSELNYGHLHLECTKILDNRFQGIRGINTILSADNIFTKGESKINYFKPFNTNHYQNYLINLIYTFDNPYTVFLRGNVWIGIENVEIQDYLEINDPILFDYDYYPTYKLTDFEQTPCVTSKEHKDGDEHCEGCITSDDNDGDYALKSNGKTIMETLREGMMLISNGDLEAARGIFQHIANVPATTIKGLHPKSIHAYEISRVYATPEVSIEARSETHDDALVKLDLKVYPNPTTNDITLNVNQAGNFRITNVGGAVVQTGIYQENDMIQLDDQTPGIYFIHYKSIDGIEKTGRFIVIK